MGLGFISAVHGLLQINELLVAATPVAVAVTTLDGQPGFELHVKQSEWKIRDFKVEALIFPSDLQLSVPEQACLIAQPTGIAFELNIKESQHPCTIGPPETYAKITAPLPLPKEKMSDFLKSNRSNKALIASDCMDACRSWKAIPTQEPQGCDL
jgi:hypothetical protein